MKFKIAAAALMVGAAFTAQAQTEVQFWHSMTAVNGEWVNDLAKNFNSKQSKVKIVPVYKGSYDESMTAAVAAFRAGNAPHILQVFEVGTATMMASKTVIVPVAQVMKDAGYKFDPSVYVAAVAGYYTAPNGQMLSFPFNSSTWTLKKPPPPGLKWPWPLPNSRPAATNARSHSPGRAGRSWRVSPPGTTQNWPPKAMA
jgi:sn-glycerol 3-phosphate transport system substrate-binding protein